MSRISADLGNWVLRSFLVECAKYVECVELGVAFRILIDKNATFALPKRATTVAGGTQVLRIDTGSAIRAFFSRQDGF